MQFAGHCLAQLIDLRPHQWVNIRVRRVFKRRYEYSCAVVSHLVSIEINLREPFFVKHTIKVLRFELCQHVTVSIIVVSGVFVIQLR